MTLRRVGHKGADLIAPGNTLSSFDAALAAGVDMIEFDVLPDGERLVLAHDYAEARRRSPHTLEEGLTHLATDPFADVELDVDLKLPGYELRVLEVLRIRAASAGDDFEPVSIEPAADPRDRAGGPTRMVGSEAAARPVPLSGHCPPGPGRPPLRAVLPFSAAAAVRRGRCDALMAHWRLVTPRLVRRVKAAGGEVYVWTVDELPRLRKLNRLGVTGVITNDPRLFTSLA